MAVKSAQLQDLAYVPNYNTLDTNLINTVDSAIQQQGQLAHQYANDDIGILTDTAMETVGILGNQQVNQRVQELTEGVRQDIDQRFKERGARGSLPFLQRRARDYAGEVGKYQQAAQSLQSQLERIDESDAGGPQKQHLKQKIQRQAQEGLFDEEGNFTGLSESPQIDILSNWQNFDERLEKFNSGWKDGTLNVESILSESDSGPTLQRLVTTGILSDDVTAANVALLTRDPQMAAQLAYELEMEGVEPYVTNEDGRKVRKQVEVSLGKDPITGVERTETVDMLTAKAIEKATEKAQPYAIREAFQKHQFSNISSGNSREGSSTFENRPLFPMTIGLDGTGIDSVADIDAISTDLSDGLEETYNKVDTYISENPEIGGRIVNPDGTINFHDGEGNIIDDSMTAHYNQEIKQNRESAKGYNEYRDSVVKRETGYNNWDEFWESNKGTIQEAQKAYNEEVVKTEFNPVTGVGRSEQESIAAAEKARNEVLNRHPDVKKVNNALKRDNEGGEILVTGIQLPDEDKEYVEELWFKDILPGTEEGLGEGIVALYDTDGNEFGAKDYEELKNYTSANVDRIFYHPQRGLQVVWVPYGNKDGQKIKHKRLLSDAPIGLEAHLIQNGMIEEVLANSNRQVVQLMQTPQRSKNIPIGENGESIQITFIPHGQQGGGKFRFQQGSQSRIFNSADEAATALAHEKRRVNE